MKNVTRCNRYREVCTDVVHVWYMRSSENSEIKSDYMIYIAGIPLWVWLSA